MTKYIFTAEELAERDERIKRQARAGAFHALAKALADDGFHSFATPLYAVKPGPDPCRRPSTAPAPLSLPHLTAGRIGDRIEVTKGDTMRYMAEYQIIEHANNIDADEFPNLARAAHTLRNLMRWTNSNSDGWAYWQKPGRAASKIVDALENYTAHRYNGTEVDLSDADLRKALAPVKAFMTRYNREHAAGEHRYSDRIEPESILA